MKKSFSILFILGSIVAFGQNWSFVNEAISRNLNRPDRFAYSTAISKNYAIVGAPNDDFDEAGGAYVNEAGAAYILERDENGEWKEIQKLVAPDRSAVAGFGHSVDIDGETAIVGAWKKEAVTADGYTLRGAGAAYIFEKHVNGNWIFKKKLLASDPKRDAHFGVSVALSGNSALVGARREKTDEVGTYPLSGAGAAYAFNQGANGQWEQAQKIVAADRDSSDLFGAALSVSGDYAIIGAWGENKDSNGNNPLETAGAAYIYKQASDDRWQEVQKIVPHDRERFDGFAHSLSISGRYAIVSSRLGQRTSGTGAAAYIFELQEDGAWEETQKLTASFDLNVSVSISGNHALIGCPNKDKDSTGGNDLTDAGTAFFYERKQTGKWELAQKVNSPNPAKNEWFGQAVDIYENKAVIAALWVNANPAGIDSVKLSGTAYMYESCFTVSHIDVEACSAYTSPGGRVLTASGTYVDTIPKAAGCDSIVNIDLTILKLNLNLGDDQLLCQGSSLALDAGNPGAEYLWQNGDTSQVLTITAPGEYWVKVKFAECEETDSIKILSPEDLLMPNIITPNGDGVNDVFAPVNGFLAGTYTLKIFDRNGRKLYQSTDYKGQWDASELADGVYFYLLDYAGKECVNQFKGFFHIMK